MGIRDSSEGEAGRLAESMDDLFSLLVSCICWHDCCDTKQYVDSKTLEEYGQRQRNCNLEDMDMDSLQRVSDALGVPTGEPVSYTHLGSLREESAYPTKESGRTDRAAEGQSAGGHSGKIAGRKRCWLCSMGQPLFWCAQKQTENKKEDSEQAHWYH